MPNTKNTDTLNKNIDISALEKSALESAKSYLETRASSAKYAVKCGSALNALKETDNKAFKELMKTMPVGLRQCQKFMTIAERWEKDGIKTNPGSSFLGVNAEARLCKVSPTVERQVRIKAKNEELSQHEIIPYIAELVAKEKKTNKNKSTSNSKASEKKKKKITREKFIFKIEESVLQIKADCAFSSDSELEDGLQEIVDKTLKEVESLMNILSDEPEEIKDKGKVK